MGGSSTGSLFFGFLVGSALTAAAAYVYVATDMERLEKEKKRLQAKLEDSGISSRDLSMPSKSTRSITSSAAAVVAAGEHVGFLTDILAQLWSYIKVAAAASIRESVEPEFKTLPGPLSGLKFTKIDLGNVPIRMDNVVVHKCDTKNNTLQFDLDLVWDGNCDIQLKAGMLSFGVKSVKLQGRMCILMRPLTTDLSIVSGIQYGFINPPDLELDFTGMAQMADFKFIDKKIRGTLQEVLASMIVLPERMLYKMEPSCNFAEIYRPPLGVVCVTIENGQGFVVEKRALRKDDIPDCYCNVSLGGKATRTKTIKDQLNPVWKDENHDFLMCDMDQIISLEVMDEDGGPLDPDDFLGEMHATVGEIMLHGGRKQFSLVDEEARPNGASVTLSCNVIKFTSKLDSLSATQGEGCFAGFLVLLIIGASNIPLKKEEASTFVKVEYDGKTFVTSPVVAAPGIDALNPVYDMAFQIPLTPSMVKNGKIKDISLSLMNGEKSTLGNTIVSHDQITAAKGNVLTCGRQIGKGSATIEFQATLLGLDRSNPVNATRGITPSIFASDTHKAGTAGGVTLQRGAATPEDYVAVDAASGEPTRVRITAGSGHGFKVEKRRLKKDDVPDVYCIVKYGSTASVWRTKTIKNNVKPVWNETKEYPFVNHGQILNIEVWDANSGRFSKDDYLGTARVTVGEFLLKGGSMEMELLVEGKPTGYYITFSCELVY